MIQRKGKRSGRQIGKKLTRAALKSDRKRVSMAQHVPLLKTILTGIKESLSTLTQLIIEILYEYQVETCFYCLILLSDED